MSDTRTKVEKLRAMADQDISPHEAAIATAKLQAMGAGDHLPPRRPPSAPAPGFGWSWTSSGTTFTSNVSSLWVRVA